MNNQNTIEKMKHMRLGGMAQMHYTNINSNINLDYTIDQYVGMLVDQEWENRENNKIKKLIKTARFRYPATILDVDYTANRQLDKNTFQRLALLDFVRNRENVIITGATGTGKSYLAQALGHQACMMSMKTLYYNTSRLMDHLKIARLEGSYTKSLLVIEKADLLILDDFGLSAFDNQARQALMDIIESKYDHTSIIVSSQIPVASWHELIGEGTVADAILDRIVHSSHRIQLKGESLRKNKLK
ncbi:MAG: ATP-binding protein [Bacteroidetes bacterium]|nr:ATP-binding protein [Bacteroidota bacterium]PIQ32103.1 MAG: ATP-binding protein [Bacteroidetes bacterium CG18_big_fil_WC_8_21_14_2_50_41_14]PIY34758.1 MAG: ATP-binding protein [Bacteroidetes bacterium CG_4_10_14_3_um_filter_42_6]